MGYTVFDLHFLLVLLFGCEYKNAKNSFNSQFDPQ